MTKKRYRTECYEKLANLSERINGAGELTQEQLDYIISQVPPTDISGKVDKVTDNSLVPDIEIAKIHISGSDNQDLSDLVVKITGKSLVDDSAISNIHAPSSDNQDLSGLQSKEIGKGLSTNDYTTTEKSKLSGIADNANNYTHPANHIPSIITQDASNRFATDAEKSTWNSKEPGNANIQIHVEAAHAPSNAQKNSDIIKAEIEAKLTGAITTHSHAGGGGGMNMLKTTADQTINSGAATFVDIADLTFPVVSGTDYAFHFYIAFQSAATTTGHKFGVNCPTGALDFWAQSQIIANGAAGVATHTERHNVVRDDMTLLTATITQAVDLAVRIEGRYKCTENGTFAARFANELAANTQIVVQKGSWGWWF